MAHGPHAACHGHLSSLPGVLLLLPVLLSSQLFLGGSAHVWDVPLTPHSLTPLTLSVS